MLLLQVINFLTYLFAAILLYYEYIRMVSEAWYAHKLFVYSNMVLHTVHLCVFFPLYWGVHISLNLVRCCVFVAIASTQWMTKKRSSKQRILDSKIDRMEILRSTSLIDQNELKDLNS